MMFQLEMYAWKSKISYASRHHAMLEMRLFRNKCPEDGVRLDSFHGLDFHSTLQRLCLMRYGKDCSLPYAEQVEEYQMEKATVAVHIIQTFCLAWLMNRRAFYVGPDERRKVHTLWRKERLKDGEISTCFQLAVKGVRNSRALALKRLDKLVEENNPDKLYGRWDPANSTLSETREERKTREKAEQRESAIRKKQQQDKEYIEQIPRSEQEQRNRAKRTLNKRKAVTQFDDTYFMSLWLNNNKDFRRLLEEYVIKVQWAYRRRLIKKVALKALVEERAAKASRLAAVQRAEREAKAAEARARATQQGGTESHSYDLDTTAEGEPIVVEFEDSGKIGCDPIHTLFTRLRADVFVCPSCTETGCLRAQDRVPCWRHPAGD